MGTFHDDKGELHGITVVVDTGGPAVWVGRCDTIDDVEIVLLDADRHEGDDASKQAYLEKAAKFGVWKRHERVAIPLAEATSVSRLGELTSE